MVNDEHTEPFLEDPAYKDQLKFYYWPILKEFKIAYIKYQHAAMKQKNRKLPKDHPLVIELKRMSKLWLEELQKLEMVKKLITDEY